MENSKIVEIIKKVEDMDEKITFLDTYNLFVYRKLEDIQDNVNKYRESKEEEKATACIWEIERDLEHYINIGIIEKDSIDKLNNDMQELLEELYKLKKQIEGKE